MACCLSRGKGWFWRGEEHVQDWCKWHFVLFLHERTLRWNAVGQRKKETSFELTLWGGGEFVLIDDPKGKKLEIQLPRALDTSAIHIFTESNTCVLFAAIEKNKIKWNNRLLSKKLYWSNSSGFMAIEVFIYELYHSFVTSFSKYELEAGIIWNHPFYRPTFVKF